MFPHTHPTPQTVLLGTHGPNSEFSVDFFFLKEKKKISFVPWNHFLILVPPSPSLSLNMHRIVVATEKTEPHTWQVNFQDSWTGQDLKCTCFLQTRYLQELKARRKWKSKKPVKS